MDDFCPPLPPSFQQPSTSSASVISSQQHQQDDEEDFAIGPTPPGTSTSHRHYARPTFTDDSADTKGREEWMLSLPDMKKKTQLSHLHGSLPTSFRKSAVPSQDDSWTKNPNEPDAPDKKKSKPSTSDRDDCFDRAYDREQEKAAKKSKKDRDSDKSLLDLHREKLKKEKKVSFFIFCLWSCAAPHSSACSSVSLF